MSPEEVRLHLKTSSPAEAFYQDVVLRMSSVLVGVSGGGQEGGLSGHHLADDS